MKIYIIGCSCSGKSTLAEKISEITDIDHIELDSYWWLPGWKEREKEQFIRIVSRELAKRRSWIIDGNYRVIRDMIIDQADMIIWLNLPFHTVLWRSFTRTISRIISKKSVCNGNKENWRALFSRDSMPLWVIKSYKSRIKYASKLIAQDYNVVELNSRKAINDFLGNFHA